jgi:hypothetical protein
MLLNFISLQTQITPTEVVQIERFLSKAQYSIWIKNLWFTHEKLKTVLAEKIRNGLSVHLILGENYINENLDYMALQDYIDIGGELFILPQKIVKALKNSTFFIVDNQRLVYHSAESSFISQQKGQQSKNLAGHIVNSYTQLFLKLETMAENVIRL